MLGCLMTWNLSKVSKDLWFGSVAVYQSGTIVKRGYSVAVRYNARARTLHFDVDCAPNNISALALKRSYYYWRTI